MDDEQRGKVLKKINNLYIKHYDKIEEINERIQEQDISYDFFEDLYEILYHFSYDEKKLLARVSKLLLLPPDKNL